MATTAELNVSEDILAGEDMLNLEDLDEKEVLGDDEEDKGENNNIVAKKELDGDDLYDAAIEPSGTINDKRESAEIQSSLPNAIQQKPIVIKSEAHIKMEPHQLGTGKRYCCYIGNMTWWTTDAELEVLVKSLGLDDLVDLKFYENRNNGQSKGFALAVFHSELSVKILMEKLPNKRLHEQSLIVLPYTKQSMAKLEEATKRPDQKGSSSAANNPPKEEKMVNIGTIRIGANGAPVPQLMSSINLAQLARPVVHQQHIHQPTSLLSLSFSTPPVPAPPGTTSTVIAPVQQPAQHARPPQAASVGLVTSVAGATSMMPPGTTTMLSSAVVTPQQQMATMVQQQQSAAAATLLLQQQQQQQQAAVAAAAAAANAAAVASQQQRQLGGIPTQINMTQPPPAHVGVQQHQPQQALQQTMSRPPPSMQSLGVNTAAPPPMNIQSGMPPTAQQQQQFSHHQQQQQQATIYRQATGAQMMATGMQQQTVQSAPGFPPGAHINPQVYPGFAHGASVTAMTPYGVHPENGTATLMSEAEFQEIMSRNQTVSSSAIHRAVTDAASGDYPSAIETLVTAISLIRQSRVAHDDRCKLLINTLQDTLNGIESKSYSSGGSRKHRRDRSRSPIRTSKRHRRSHSRSRSRDRGGYDYSPIRHSTSRRY